MGSGLKESCRPSLLQVNPKPHFLTIGHVEAFGNLRIIQVGGLLISCHAGSLMQTDPLLSSNRSHQIDENKQTDSFQSLYLRTYLKSLQESAIQRRQIMPKKRSNVEVTPHT